MSGRKLLMEKEEKSEKILMERAKTMKRETILRLTPQKQLKRGGGQKSEKMKLKNSPKVTTIVKFFENMSKGETKQTKNMKEISNSIPSAVVESESGNISKSKQKWPSPRECIPSKQSNPQKLKTIRDFFQKSSTITSSVKLKPAIMCPRTSNQIRTSTTRVTQASNLDQNPARIKTL